MGHVIEVEFPERALVEAAFIDHQLEFRAGCRFDSLEEAQVTVDISNRPYLYFDAPIKDQKVGTFDTALAKEFLRALALHAGLTLHINVAQGDNTHHIIEAVFKALGRALGQAVSPEPRSKGPLSSKGSL